jgi:hypothetical protein
MLSTGPPGTPHVNEEKMQSPVGSNPSNVHAIFPHCEMRCIPDLGTSMAQVPEEYQRNNVIGKSQL